MIVKNDTFQQLVLPILTQCYALTFTNDEKFFIPNPNPDNSPFVKIVFQNVDELYRLTIDAHRWRDDWSPEELKEKYEAILIVTHDIMQDEYFGIAMKRRSIAFSWCRCLYLALIIEERVTNPDRPIPASPIKIDAFYTTAIMTYLIEDLRALIAKKNAPESPELTAEARRLKNEMTLFLTARHLDDSRSLSKAQQEMMDIMGELVVVVLGFFSKNEEISDIFKEGRHVPSSFDLDTALELRKGQKDLLFQTPAERLTIHAIEGVHVFNKYTRCHVYTKIGCFYIATYDCGDNNTLEEGYSQRFAVVSQLHPEHPKK